jgi:hypothetical protein
MAANLSVFEGSANCSGPNASVLASASTAQGELLPAISSSSLCTAFYGSPAFASSSEVSVPLGC